MIISQTAVFLHPRCVLPMAINQSPQDHAYSTMGADLLIRSIKIKFPAKLKCFQLQKLSKHHGDNVRWIGSKTKRKIFFYEFQTLF